MGRAQALGMLLETFDAEELGANRLFHRKRTVDGGGGDQQIELSLRDVERMLPFPRPREAVGLDRFQTAMGLPSGDGRQPRPWDPVAGRASPGKPPIVLEGPGLNLADYGACFKPGFGPRSMVQEQLLRGGNWPAFRS
jgi:hypothetical protein